MRFNRKAALAVAASLAVATTAVAATKVEPSHVMEVALPDGGVAHIRYSGDVAPRIVFAPVGASAFAPIAFDAFDTFDAAPFAMFDRIAADMDVQAAAMVRQMDLMRRQASMQPGGAASVSTGTLPAGAVSYSFVSTSGGKGACSRSVEVTSLGDGKQPKVVSQTSGDCGPAASQAPAPGVTAQSSVPSIRT